MGRGDRERRAHPGDLFARHAHGDLRPPGPGGAVATGGHAARDGDCRRRRAVERGRDASRPCPDGAACGTSRRREEAVRHSRRVALERGRGCGRRGAFAERFDLPVGCSLRRQMLFDHDHPNYAGDVGIGINPALAHACQGSRRAPPHRRADERDAIRGLHADRHSRTPGRSWSTSIRARRSSAGSTGRRLRSMRARTASSRRSKSSSRRRTIRLASETRAANEAYRAWSTPKSNPGPVQLGQLVTWLRERLPDDAIVTNGAGNYTGWVHRFFRFRRFNTQLAPLSGSMGYGLPAAIAAKLRYPERMVVAFAGDGCFQLTSQEVRDGGAVRRGGDHRHHQQRHPRHDPHAPGARLSRPGDRDGSGEPGFRRARARLWRRMARRVATTEDFAPAFERAVASGKAADHRGEDRPGGDQPIGDALRHPREATALAGP